MSTASAQGHSDSESATNLPTNQAISSVLPPQHTHLPPPLAKSRPQSSLGQSQSLSDMTSLSSVPRMDQPEDLAPVFHARSYSHLPTPQSPSNLSRYVNDLPHTPHSPLPNVQQHSGTSNSYQRLAPKIKSVEGTPSRSQGSKQCITPESSPSYGSRGSPPHIALSITPSARYNINDTTGTLNPAHAPFPAAVGPPHLAPSPHISSPISDVSEHSSHLPPRFMAGLPVGERIAQRNQAHSAPSSPVTMEVDDVFSSPSRVSHQTRMNTSTPPGSLSQASTSAAGGEIERIRQALIREHLTQIQEAEVRRPEYLKRSKRPLSEVDSTIFVDDRERDRGPAVGITESPSKGRRLKLFQETSEESFEESLMAGGYGRYRTNDWVRQPQPLSFLGPHNTGSPKVAELLVEHVEEVPPSEKELKKRKRLEAFRSSKNSRSKLTPVDLVGKGRVLLELPGEETSSISATPESSPSKKRGGGGKRKRKSVDLTSSNSKDKQSNRSEEPEGPNWPDDQFPWKLRKEEHNEAKKALEDERLSWIEKFLNRDTDEEEDVEPDVKVVDMGLNRENLPPAKWGFAHEDETDKPAPVRMGRGKMVPLLAHPEDPRRAYAKKKSVFPSDPADARAALLAKKSVRALAYRNQRRRRDTNKEADEDAVICICNGKDDGRELVQCDGCQTWYHLLCIGIRNIAELGREEDAWFCRSCITRLRSPSPERNAPPVVYREPTFVPTEEIPRVPRTHDPTLYQPLHNSPLWNPPRVPTTPTRGRNFDPDAASSSDSSRLPSTPQNPTHDIRLYNTPGPFEYQALQTHEDPPFDPNTTPSRGIKFPKSNPWSVRVGGLFHTPSRHHSRSSFSRSFGSMEDIGASFGAFDGLTRYPNVEDSPIRRNDGSRVRKGLESPPPARTSLRPGPEESPVVRFQPHRDAGRLPGVTGPSTWDGSLSNR